uniref:Predicted protein n=1 Tax=Hordeum vulgare subsp. vulgare TaxID=112509 RepID=F2E8H8_HORVV|nr:predicted protein [Hordeum vulgare subsp. vulgare]
MMASAQLFKFFYDYHIRSIFLASNIYGDLVFTSHTDKLITAWC